MILNKISSFKIGLKIVEIDGVLLKAKEEGFENLIHKIWQPWDGQIYLNPVEGWEEAVELVVEGMKLPNPELLKHVSFGTFDFEGEHFERKVETKETKKAEKTRKPRAKKVKITETNEVNSDKKTVNLEKTTVAEQAKQRSQAVPLKDVVKKAATKLNVK